MAIITETRRNIELERANEFRRNAPEVLDVASAAAFLGISERVLTTNLESLGIPHKIIGRTILFSKRRLVEWIEKTD